ncbi:MAG: sugar kinase [Candidatus Izimaplasma sp.]|nr:sugar kinase [Candidatus Izimaplasma bacterium]
MSKIITFGEIMLRLSPNNHQRFIQANNLDVVYGGGEANVAVSLAMFNQASYFVSKVPDHAIGQAAINHLKHYGVQTDYMALGGKRLGIYYLESGVSMRPSQVIYDRQNSAISEANVEDFDFEEIFKDATWFHWSGITPALSDAASNLVLKACQVAKKHNVTISVDLNYRKKLWSTKKAQKVMKSLMTYVDVCIGNEEDAKNILGYSHSSTDVSSGKLVMSDYKETLKKMVEDFDFKVAVTTLRESLSASHNKWHALMYDGKEFIESSEYDIIPIVDRVGAGDSFSAGFIYGMLNKDTMREAIEFATAASALKHTIKGDQNLVIVSEVEQLKNGDKSGRVKR